MKRLCPRVNLVLVALTAVVLSILLPALTPQQSGVRAQNATLTGTVTPATSPSEPLPSFITPAAPEANETNAGQTNEAAVEPTSALSSPLGQTPAKMLEQADYLTSETGIVNSLKMLIVLSVLSLAPAILMMTTSFVRIITVLSILRQALGTGQLPPNQVLTTLSIFLTILIMAPVWTEVYDKGVKPYTAQQITATEAIQAGGAPVRTFMIKQLERTDNMDTLWMFMRYTPEAKTPEFYDEVPWTALLPAFMVSELKTAFLIGFQLFLPFLIIDLVVSAVLVSMGMMMLPPVMISLPFKLLLFVLLDGWTLVVKMLLDSFVWYAGG
ncbi:MAG: flagellar type III secretion system pore protein FliP [Planctomycetia bacterium]|nr:flagellar type III secretion system pore protein FliP [Planctomycetia bacterium]